MTEEEDVRGDRVDWDSESESDDIEEDEDSDDEWREETERIKKELDWDNLQETIARLETKWKAEGKVPMHEMDKWNPFHPPNLDDEAA